MRITGMAIEACSMAATTSGPVVQTELIDKRPRGLACHVPFIPAPVLSLQAGAYAPTHWGISPD
jgi:hypothetical protein